MKDKPSKTTKAPHLFFLKTKMTKKKGRASSKTVRVHSNACWCHAKGEFEFNPVIGKRYVWR